MIRTITLFGMLLFVGALKAEETEKPEKKPESSKILLVGNSYTSGPLGTFARVLRESPHAKSIIKGAIKNGKTLKYHADNTETIQRIKNGGWDIVILQEQSQAPTLTGKFQNNFFAAVKELSKVSRQSGAQPLLYLTWGRRDGDKQNLKINPDFETMQDNLNKAYEKAARENDCRIIPVGKVWASVRKNNPELGKKLYGRDGSHPSATGKWLISCVFMRFLFDANVDKIKPGKAATAQEADIIRTCIKEVMQ